MWILSKQNWQFVSVYLDGIALEMSRPEEHAKHVRHVFVVLCEACVFVELKKFELLHNKVNCLLHFIHPGQLAVSKHSIDIIPDLKPHTNIVKPWLVKGLCNVFRPFVTNSKRFSVLVSREMLKDESMHLEALPRDKSFALRTLKQKLITPLVLYLPRTKCTHTFDTFACDLQAGYVLLEQRPSGLDKLIGCWAR